MAERLAAIGEKLTEYGPKLVEYVTTDKFVKFVRNVVFFVMVGMMVYVMIRAFSVVAASAEYVAGQWASLIGTMVTLMVPIMILFLVISIVKAVMKWFG